MKATIQVKGMCCPRCVHALKDELTKLSPIHLLVRMGEVEIEYGEERISRQQIEDAIADAGFEVMTLLRERKIEEAKSYVRDHLSDPEAMRLSVMAHSLAICPFHLSRTFSLTEGETLQDFLMHARMELAARLLRETERTVLDICGEVGLSSPSHFTKEFKKRYGRTPLRYRTSPDVKPGPLSRLHKGSAAVVARLRSAVGKRLFPHHGRYIPSR